MKKTHLLLGCFLAFTLSVFSQTKIQSVYIDFGKNDVANGNITASPDDNGNYWNNAIQTAWNSILDLVNSENGSTGYTLQITKGFASNGIQNGGLLAPDQALLGDFAVATATQDYFYVDGSTGNGSFKIKNLSAGKAYKFYVFGSRSDDKNQRIGYYTFNGANGFHGTHQMGGPNMGTADTPAAHNNVSSIFETDYIFPDHKGEVHFHMAIKNGGYAHINIMKIEEYSDVEDMYVWQKFYIDCGRNDNSNGRITLSPDANGSSWNNAIDQEGFDVASGNKIKLVNSYNGSSAIEMELLTPFRANGPNNGALTTPDVALLNDLAIQTATEDYLFVEQSLATGMGTIEFRNMNKDKGYRFHVFGSRSDAGDRIGLFTFTGTNSCTGVHKMSGANFGGQGINQNNSDVLVSNVIYPDGNGTIRLDLVRYASTFSYINVMKIEECDDVPYVEATSASLSGQDITVSGNTSQMSVLVLPEGAFYHAAAWSVDDPSVAYINQDGLLYPKKNGSVTVTADINSSGNVFQATKQIIISNQGGTISFAGSASEEDEAVEMKMLSSGDGIVSNKFELYTSLSTGSFYFFREVEGGSPIRYGAGGEDGRLAVDGSEIANTVEGPVRINVDLENMEYTITPITSVLVVGSSSPNGSGVANGLEIAYKGKGVWSKLIKLHKSNDANFNFIINKNESECFKRVSGTNEVILASVGEEFGIPMENIRTNMNGGMFDVTIDLRSYTYAVSCGEVNDLKISYMGSSVCSGTGATRDEGYAYMYTQLLRERFKDGLGLDWVTSNVSIGGNNTSNLLNRWERDLLSNCSSYVIYGLSLGNEGIHERGEPAYISYRDGMLQAIEQAKEAGIVPVMANNYTRADFNATDYNYIKKLNMLIHEWDVPSINTLGAIDDGAGRWASGYEADNAHPNTAGHREFFYAMVPSLFDALEAGKPLPARVSGTSYSLEKGNVIKFIPENIVHPFTISFDMQTTGKGTIASFEHKLQNGILKINDEGKLVYTSPSITSITSTSSIADGEWHKITLTHYYAWGVTMLYIDNALQGQIKGKLTPASFMLGDSENAPDNVMLRELFFWRAGMNAEEITALNAGKMLKSSLEIYAPLGGEKDLENLAQSTNTLELIEPEKPDFLATNKYELLELYPNPVQRGDNVNISGNGTLKIYTLQGDVVYEQQIGRKTTLSTEELVPGYYIVYLNNTYAKLIVK